jgi:cell division septation protein DedD
MIRKSSSILVVLMAVGLSACVGIPANTPRPQPAQPAQPQQPAQPDPYTPYQPGYTDPWATPPAATPVSGTPYNAGYVVQLIASISPEKAESIKSQYAADGHKAFVNTDLANGGAFGQSLYRVQIGPYSNKWDAENKLQQMKSRYPYDELVQQAIVNENF